jgi:hypothetical protein
MLVFTKGEIKSKSIYCRNSEEGSRTFLRNITTYITTTPPRSRVLLEKLTVPDLVSNFLNFMEPGDLLTQSQQPSTLPYSEPDKSNPCISIPLFKDPF